MGLTQKTKILFETCSIIVCREGTSDTNSQEMTPISNMKFLCLSFTGLDGIIVDAKDGVSFFFIDLVIGQSETP
jgi:hypothetical protein